MGIRFPLLGLILFMVLEVQGGGWPRKDVPLPLAKKSTTVLVYMLVDSGSAADLYFDLQEMQKIGSNEKMNVLVYTTFANGTGNKSRALVVQKGKSFQDGQERHDSSGWVQPILDACTWAHEKFPSDNFILLFCNHATDFYFTEHDVCQSLSYAVNLRDNKLVDLVAFNAPMMACIEVAHAIQPYARFLVASEGIIPGKWYPYTAALQYAAQWKYRFSPYKLALSMIDEYEDRYSKETNTYTLSVMDLAAEPKLFHALDVIAAGFDVLLDSQDGLAIQQIINESGRADECTYFGEPSCLDLGHLLNNLQANVAQAKIPNKQEILKQAAKDIIAAKCALSGCVVDCVQGSLLREATGMTISIKTDSCLGELMRNLKGMKINYSKAAL